MGTSGSVLVNKLDLEISMDAFKSNWVPHSYGLMPHLRKKKQINIEEYALPEVERFDCSFHRFEFQTTKGHHLHFSTTSRGHRSSAICFNCPFKSTDLNSKLLPFQDKSTVSRPAPRGQCPITSQCNIQCVIYQFKGNSEYRRFHLLNSDTRQQWPY